MINIYSNKQVLHKNCTYGKLCVREVIFLQTYKVWRTAFSVSQTSQLQQGKTILENQ